ncbi:MAG: hypothetical protein ABI488_18915 [Polyangiaceae bacterium]
MSKLALLLSVVGIGFGFAALPGCNSAAVEESPENVLSEQANLNSCYTNSGMQPTKAALAVAMAMELGRWDAADDLERVTSNWVSTVQVKSSAVCLHNGCKNTKGLLGQQDQRVEQVQDQNTFSPANYRNDMIASFQRDAGNLSDLQRNKPWQLPPAHKLTLVGGPVNLGHGACGPHYVFQADHTNGTPLSYAEAQNLVNALCFFGAGICGANPYISFTVTHNSCPTGRTCVAVDPTDGDNSSTTTTTSGSAPTYPLNRLWDTANTHLNSACQTTTGKVGSMVSRCATIPGTCGYLYCVAR